MLAVLDAGHDLPLGGSVAAQFVGDQHTRRWDRPEMWGIMTIGIGPAGYVAGWGFADGMDAAFGRDGD